MGFLNKKPVIRQEGFHPLELNEDNVRAIFNRCLVTKDTPEADEQLSILFKKIMGYEEKIRTQREGMPLDKGEP